MIHWYLQQINSSRDMELQTACIFGACYILSHLPFWATLEKNDKVNLNSIFLNIYYFDDNFLCRNCYMIFHNEDN